MFSVRFGHKVGGSACASNIDVWMRDEERRALAMHDGTGGEGQINGEGEETDESSSQNGGQAGTCNHIGRVKSVILL